MTKQFVARTSRAVSPSTRSGSAFPLMWILKNFIDRIFTYRRHEGTDKSKYLQHSEMAEVRFTSRRVRFNVDTGSDLVTLGFFSKNAPEQSFHGMPPNLHSQTAGRSVRGILTNSQACRSLVANSARSRCTSARLSTSPVSLFGSPTLKLSRSNRRAAEILVVNDARVLKTDIVASNGVIHVIDSVILPK
jgi:hypothetical protein